MSTDGECPPKRVTSPVRPFTGAKTGTAQVFSSNESHIQAKKIVSAITNRTFAKIRRCPNAISFLVTAKPAH